MNMPPNPYSLTSEERGKILEVLKLLALSDARFKNLYKDNKDASDEKLMEIVDNLEDMVLEEEKNKKQQAKTVMDTLDFESVLADAAGKGDTGLMKYLIEDKGVDVNDMGPLNTTPLFSAIQHNQIDAVKLLLSYPKTDINYISGGGNTPLMSACRFGYKDIVDMLLDDPRIEVNKQSTHGATALHNASGMGHIDIVERLLLVPHLELTSNYTEQNHSAISIAKQNGHFAIAKRLEQWQQSNSTPKPKMF